MQSPKKQYLREINKALGYFATWHPGVHLRTGDIGLLKNNEFQRVSSISEMDLPMVTRKASQPVDLHYASEGGVSVHTKASGDATPDGCSLGKLDAGIIVQFGKKAGIVFQAKGIITESIENQNALGDELIRRYKAGAWDKSHAVITELVEAASATIIVSNGQAARLELKAAANANVADLSLADINADLKILSKQNIFLQIIAAQGLRPLFKPMGIRTSFGKLPRTRLYFPHPPGHEDLIYLPEEEMEKMVYSFGLIKFEDE